MQILVDQLYYFSIDFICIFSAVIYHNYFIFFFKLYFILHCD